MAQRVKNLTSIHEDAEAGSCGSNSTPSLRTLIYHRHTIKKKKNQVVGTQKITVKENSDTARNLALFYAWDGARTWAH